MLVRKRKEIQEMPRTIDSRLEGYYLDGYEVVPRSLLKSPEEIEGIKRSAAINIGVLDYLAGAYQARRHHRRNRQVDL